LCHGSWNVIAHTRLFCTISGNLKLKRKGKGKGGGKGKGSPELHHPNGSAINGAGGVGRQNAPMNPGRIGRCSQARGPGCRHLLYK